MSVHRLADSDRLFRESFESFAVTPACFDHRSHLRLAYAYLADSDDEQAFLRMRDALLAFLAHHSIPASKYHETLTRAWILAVRHFMSKEPSTESFDAFVSAHPDLLDSKIMFTHYSTELLFSPRARESFVDPDLSKIPRHPR